MWRQILARLAQNAMNERQAIIAAQMREFGLSTVFGREGFDSSGRHIRRI